MLKLKNNKSGITFMDTLVSLVVFLTIILFISRFEIFLKTSTITLDKKIVFLEAVNNEISEIYEIDDWSSLTQKTIATDFGDIKISYIGYVEETPVDTNKITIKFEFNGSTEQYDIERSVFYNA